MIPVAPQPEPANFEARVRTRGRAFLRTSPSPQQIRKRNYWKECLSELRQAYGEICAYSACWVHSEGTVDHFCPLTERPDLAYEWDNYRLAFSKLNSYKSQSTDVLDPFHIQPGWFTLNFDNLFVEPNAGLSPKILTAVEKTVEVLRLNTDDRWISLRFTIVKEYAEENLTLEYLLRWYPFIGMELKRQNLIDAIKGYFP